MASINCPGCGIPLDIDALTGELRPCSRCGAIVEGTPENPVHSPEHQARIFKQKGFEIGAVIVMILVGLGYLALTMKASENEGGESFEGAEEIAASLEHLGFVATGESTILGRRFVSFQQIEGVFENSIDFVSPIGEDHVETLIIGVSIPAGDPVPTRAVNDDALRGVINASARLGAQFIPTSPHALAKAAGTMVKVGEGTVRHSKGVAQTTDGWKLTYITYHDYEETGEETPILLMIYQMLSSATDPGMEAFNGALYEGINVRANLKESMRAREALGGAPQP